MIAAVWLVYGVLGCGPCAGWMYPAKWVRLWLRPFGCVVPSAINDPVPIPVPVFE